MVLDNGSTEDTDNRELTRLNGSWPLSERVSDRELPGEYGDLDESRVRNFGAGIGVSYASYRSLLADSIWLEDGAEGVKEGVR